MEKIIKYFDHHVKVGCDQKCNKAWGHNSRPKIQFDKNDEDDYAYLSDNELGEAPTNPGTYEGGHAKPFNESEILNKWCVRECERCVMSKPNLQLQLPDFSNRIYNQPWKHINNLRLPLKRKWFEKSKELIKNEDYREITPYWYKRLVHSGIVKIDKQLNTWDLIQVNSFKQFKINTMTLGYPKSSDTERILNFKHEGIEVRTGNPEWGAEPGKKYFVIKHGFLIQ